MVTTSQRLQVTSSLHTHTQTNTHEDGKQAAGAADVTSIELRNENFTLLRDVPKNGGQLVDVMTRGLFARQTRTVAARHTHTPHTTHTHVRGRTSTATARRRLSAASERPRARPSAAQTVGRRHVAGRRDVDEEVAQGAARNGRRWSQRPRSDWCRRGDAPSATGFPRSLGSLLHRPARWPPS